MDRKIEIFCCYAHEDKSLLRGLRAQLMLLERQKIISIWSDVDISPGTVQLNEVIQHLNTAQIILLLISPDFIQSNYCYDIMQRAMERQKRETVYVIPIILRPVDLRGAPIAGLYMLPTNMKPVTLWKDRDSAFLEIAQAIGRVVNSMYKPDPPLSERNKPATMGNTSQYSHNPQAPIHPPPFGASQSSKENSVKKHPGIFVLLPLLIIGMLGGSFYYVLHFTSSPYGNSENISKASNSTKPTMASNGAQTPVASDSTSLTPQTSSNAHVVNVVENRKLLCTACGDPALGIVLDSITIDSSNITTILNFTITNSRTGSCVLGYFSTLALQDPEGTQHHVQQNNQISIAPDGSVKDNESFSNFTPVQDTQYVLDITFSHYSGCASSGDDIYQNENLTFSASQTAVKPASGTQNIVENRKLLCTACGDPALGIMLDSITIDSGNVITVLNFTFTNTSVGSCAFGYFSTLALQDPEGTQHHVQQNNQISLAPNGSIKDFEDFNFVPVKGTQYTLNIAFSHYSGCTSSSLGDNNYQNMTLTF